MSRNLPEIEGSHRKFLSPVGKRLRGGSWVGLPKKEEE